MGLGYAEWWFIACPYPCGEHLDALSHGPEIALALGRPGFRTYAMFCPLLPGIADSPQQIDELVRLAVEFGAQKVFAESVNGRGPGLPRAAEFLAEAGYHDEAAAVDAVRNGRAWSAYTRRLVRNVQASVRRHFDIDRLRVLLYPSRLNAEDTATILDDDAGVIWLGKGRPGEAPESDAA